MIVPSGKRPSTSVRERFVDRGTTTMGKAPKIPVNNISFVNDRSGSMWSIKKDVVKVFNEQLKAIKEQAKRGDQETFVSLYTFNSKVDKPLYLRRQAQAVKPLKSINASG